MAGGQRSWTLWTVWSSHLGDLMDSRELSTTEFASQIIAVVQEKDAGFKFKQEEDLRVIKPTKLLDIEKDTVSGSVRVEIGGVVFRPGTRYDDGGFGKRWRMIAANKLAILFSADKKFTPYRLSNEIFIVINAGVLESARQIWMDDCDRDTKIIRLITEQIKPGMDNRYERVPSKFQCVWKTGGSPQYVILKVSSSPYSSILNILLRSTRKRSRDTRSNDESSPAKARCISNNTNNSSPKNINSGTSQANGSEQLAQDVCGTEGSPTMIYHNLGELERDLNEASTIQKGEPANILKNRNVYGLVDQVIQMPNETVKIGESESYLLRISDESKNNVLVRLCTGVRGLKMQTIFCEVGPPINTGDIIRIHQAAVQYEASECEPDFKELVVSTSPHLNYTIFNNDCNINTPITYIRLAKGTKALKDGDEEIIRNLRRFSAARITASAPVDTDSSIEDIFYDSHSHVSSDESFKSDQSIEEYEEVSVLASAEDNKKILDEGPFTDDDSQLLIMIPGSEAQSGNESNVMEKSSRRPVREIDTRDAVILSSSIRSVSTNDCETKQNLVLQGRICDVMEVFEEDSIFVTVTDGTKPTLNFEKLIQFEDNPICRNPHGVDIAIRKVSENVSVRRAILNQLGSQAVVFRNVKVLKQQSDNTFQTFQLCAEAKTIFLES